MELGNYIQSMELSGTDVNQLRVERMLKIAIPATCVIIMLFGAPLATSSQRGGAAYGVGVSLGTTVIFLMLVQLTQARRREGAREPGACGVAAGHTVSRGRRGAARSRPHVGPGTVLTTLRTPRAN